MADVKKPKKIGKSQIAACIAILGIVNVLMCMVALVFVDIPEPNKDLFNQGFGAMIAWSTMGAHYYLGSSTGSKEKTAHMAAEMAQDGS